MIENNKVLVRAESLDEIVFSGRNKEYGAYWLRKRYNRFIFVAFIIAFSVVGTAVIIPLINSYYNRNKQLRLLDKSVTAVMEKVNNEEAPPPPPPPPPPAAIEAQVKFKAPVVVDTVKEEAEIASVDEQMAAPVEAPPTELVVEEKKEEVVEEEQVFIAVEESATFQGGDLNNFRNWVQSNIVYPAAASEAGISGKVYVQFVVSSKGAVEKVSIMRGLHPEVDKEVVRVLMKSPSWTPGKQSGRSVRQQFVLPISFTLQ